MKADDFLSQYQMMEQYGVASAEEVKVENLADHTQNRDHSCRNGVRDAMLRPKLLLLDEASFGLAPFVAQEIYQLLSGVADGGVYASLALALMIDLTLAV
jgi:ABC-type molybdenum transport system ATPase subunit/photorepair protein PhrA